MVSPHPGQGNPAQFTQGEGVVSARPAAELNDLIALAPPTSYHRLVAASLSLSSIICSASAWSLADSSAPLRPRSASDRSLAELMIEDSDNDAATSLWYEVGGPSSIRAFNSAAGLAHTTPSPCVDCAGFPWPGWGLTTTVPGDQLALLRALVEPNSLLTDAERSYALSLMENVTPDQRWGVSGGVPAQATVALKNGWLPLNSADSDWQINSVGWISGSGRDYLMAVLTTGNPTEQYGIDTIDQLAAMVWHDMA